MAAAAVAAEIGGSVRQKQLSPPQEAVLPNCTHIICGTQGSPWRKRAACGIDNVMQHSKGRCSVHTLRSPPACELHHLGGRVCQPVANGQPCQVEQRRLGQQRPRM